MAFIKKIRYRERDCWALWVEDKSNLGSPLLSAIFSIYQEMQGVVSARSYFKYYQSRPATEKRRYLLLRENGVSLFDTYIHD